MEEAREWFRAFHIIGIVLWFGSLLQVTRMLKARVRAPEASRPTLSDMERRTQLFIGFPGLFLTVSMGVLLLVGPGGPADGAGFYMKQGWMHVKLTLVLVAIGVDVLLYRAIRRYDKQPGGVLGPLLMHITGGLVLIAVAIIMKVWAEIPAIPAG